MRLVLDARTAALASSIDSTAALDPQSDIGRALSDHREVASSHENWAMNLFVAPASRLEQVAAAATRSFRRGDAPLRIGVVADTGLGPAVALITDFHQEMAPALEVSRVEFDADDDGVGLVLEAATSLDQETACFIRLRDAPTPESVAGVRRALVGVGRTGGIALTDPSSNSIAAAVWEGSYGGVPFNVPCGLDAPFTEEGTGKIGIVNVVVASAAAESGDPRNTVEEILADTDPAAFSTGASAWAWRGLPFPGSAIRRSRSTGLLSFGSPNPSALVERLAKTDTLGAGT